jgi:hypothetical protein
MHEEARTEASSLGWRSVTNDRLSSKPMARATDSYFGAGAVLAFTWCAMIWSLILS